MAFNHEKQSALRILEGIERGTMNASESFGVLDDADPTLVYFIFKWLRTWYRDHPAAEGVLGRLGAVCSAHPALTRKAKSGGEDPVVEWFESTYAYKDFTGSEFIDVVVEKLES